MRLVSSSIILTALALGHWCRSARAELILNEALANEPGSVTTTEWVEILNWPDTGAALSIKGYRYLDGGDTTSIDTNLIVPPGGFLILARKVTGTSSFESTWGDNSGVWGDGPSESCPVIGVTKMSLRNATDTITLISPAGARSVIWWKSDVGDGISIERVRPGLNDDLANFRPCTAVAGATPGHANSVFPGRHDLLLDSVTCSLSAPSWGDTITFVSTVQNYGTGAVVGAEFAYWRDRAPLPTDTDCVELMAQPLGLIEELGSALPRWNWTDAPPGVSHILCQIRGDSNALNNSAWVDLIVRFTQPHLIVSEFLATPGPGGPDEWVEIANVAGFPINLEGMRIGDSLNSEEIPTQPREIQPGEFWVLAENVAGFHAFYPQFNGVVIGISGWRALNNSGDGVRLWGPTGEIIDSLTFRTTYEDNRSLERVELTPSFARSGDWAGSTAADGATPGRANSIQRGQPGTLRIDSVWLDPPYPQWGEAIRIRSALHNVGFGPAEGWMLDVSRDLDFSSPGTQLSPIAQLTVPILGEGDEIILDADWTDAPPGLARIAFDLQTPEGESADTSALVTAISYTQPLIIISEYMAAPATAGPDEWVELDNASDISLNLSGLRLGDSSAFTAIPPVIGSLGPPGFVVVCQDASQFTAFYPNFSGDLIELPGWRPLGDQGDGLRLLGPSGEIIDSLTYLHAPTGNVSTERRQLVPDFADPRDWGDCIDPDGATPGRVNSIWRLMHDLAVDSIRFESDRPAYGQSLVGDVWISNRGFTTESRPECTVFLGDPERFWIEEGLKSEYDLPPGLAVNLPFSLAGVPPGFVDVHAAFRPDENTANDELVVAIGIEFAEPTILVSEFLANPMPGGPGEWIELHNTGGVDLSLRELRIGDADGAAVIATGADSIGTWAVLVQDSVAFRNHYVGFSGKLLQVGDWTGLNNSGDLIRLVGPYGETIDSLSFATVYDDNHSSERTDLARRFSTPTDWAMSVDPSGGTPGRDNSVSSRDAQPLRIAIQPNPVYRSYGQIAGIHYTLEIGERLTLKIFDRDGHPVRTLADDQAKATGSMEWDGTGDDGAPLRPGPYIIWARSEPSGDEVKSVIVLAP